MYQKLRQNSPVKIKTRMNWQPIALLYKQTRPITSGPDLSHNAIYRDFLYYLSLILLLNVKHSPFWFGPDLEFKYESQRSAPGITRMWHKLFIFISTFISLFHNLDLVYLFVIYVVSNSCGHIATVAVSTP